MKRTDMVRVLTELLKHQVRAFSPEVTAAQIMNVLERYGMEPPVILKKGESDGPGEGELVNEWED